MAGVEDAGRLPDRLVLGLLARAGHELHVGAEGAHLRDLGRLRRRGAEDAHLHARRGAEGGDRRAAIARAVLEDRPDPGLSQVGHHHRRAAVLEAGGRREPLELEEQPRPLPLLLDERRAALAEADRRDRHRQRGAVAPDRALAALDVVATHAGQRAHHQRPAGVRAPARLMERIGPPVDGIYVARGHGSSLRPRAGPRARRAARGRRGRRRRCRTSRRSRPR